MIFEYFQNQYEVRGADRHLLDQNQNVETVSYNKRRVNGDDRAQPKPKPKKGKSKKVTSWHRECAIKGGRK